MATPKRKPRKRAGGRRKQARPGRSRRRRPFLTFVIMLMVSALLMWGVIEVSRQGRSARQADGHGHGGAHSEITEQDRQQLRELLESIDDEQE